MKLKRSMKTVKPLPSLSLWLLTGLLFLVSCTSKPIELLAPETLEVIEQENQERLAVGITLLYATDNHQVWSNISWYPDGTWNTSPMGEVYPNTTDWMKVIWRPTDNLFEVHIQPQMIGYSGIEIKEDENCGETEQMKRSEKDGFQVLTFWVDDDFVNCLDNTGHQIKLDMTILI